MERCPKKAARHGGEWFIPGGRVETVDSDTADALTREMREELGCTPRDFHPLPIIDAKGGHDWPSFLMQPFVVTAWVGDVPAHCLDHPDVPLRWVEQAEAMRSPSAVVRAVIAASAAHTTTPRAGGTAPCPN